MPLKQGSSKAIIEANIKELIAAGHKPDQAAAIAYKEAGVSNDSAPHAAGIMYRADDKVLFLKRSDDAKDYAGHWCFPGGGIDEGENPEQAARRESKEEVGYSPDGELKKISEHDGFATYVKKVDHFYPVLNEEHTGFVWASIDDMPTPMHPGVLKTINSGAMDRREYNQFGWMTVEGNPITKVGVFPYLGRQIGAPEPDRVYMVYRPEEELNNPETIESFKLTPFINEHPTALLGNVNGLVATDKKRVEGVFGEKVYFEYPYLKANLRIYSEQALESIDLGKEELSAGYSCRWSRESGVFEGQEYHYVQRDIRGNHGALVDEGRSGPDVSVMDSMTFNLDSKEQQMDLTELVKAVATLTGEMSAMKGAMDSMKAAMDESAKEDEKEVEKDDKAMDEDEDKEDSEKAMDEDKESKEDKKGEGMDSAAFKKAVAAEVKKQLAAKPAAMDSAAIMADIAKKADLVARVTPIIGTFACDSMTHVQVAEYAAEKLGLDKSHAVVAVDSYLKARPAVQAAYGMDNADVKQSSGAAFLAEQLK